MLKHKIKLCLFVGMGCIGLFSPTSVQAKAQVEWISLYRGNEAQFSTSDRYRVLQALNALGVAHQEKLDTREILVNAQNRSLIQDLVANIFTQSSRVSKAENQ